MDHDRPSTPNDVKALVQERGIRFIRLWFTDILGQLKSFSIHSEQLDDAFEGGMGFDGSSITGFNAIEESDMIALPDPSTFAVLAPLVNSYKRLVPGYEAPVYIGWARINRSALIRIPQISKGSDNSTRIELRCPDPSTNPYLAFAAMLAALADVDGPR